MNKLSVFVALILSALLVAEIPAQSKRPGSSSSSKSSSSSRPSSGSKPSSRPPSSSSSKPPSISKSTPSSKPVQRPSSSYSSTPSPSSSNSSKPSKSFDSTASSAQKNAESRKVFESSKKPTPYVQERPKPSQPAVVQESKPVQRPSSSFPPVVSSENSNSKKPTKSFDSTASSAQKNVESRKSFEASKPVVVSKPVTSKIQTTTTKEEVAQRPQRIEHHYHRYYGDRYTTYRSQPYIDIGGGYSPIFWYAMADWSAERRAMWFYHNQNTINRDLYEQELRKNSALAAEVNRLHTQNVSVNPQYVDKEFVDNPDLMYSDAVVAAAVKPKSSFSWWYIIIPFGLLLVGTSVYFVFVHDFKVKEE